MVRNIRKAKVWMLNKPIKIFPKSSDFTLFEEDVPDINNGEFLAEAVYFAIDPYLKFFGKVGTTVIGQQVAKIIDSKNGNFPVGKYVVGDFGWRTLTVSSGERRYWLPAPYLISDTFENLTKSLALGIAGFSGLTAYFGFLEICKPNAGDTVVITAAAGSVGSVVGQIAKIKGCKVIGITSEDDKGKWLVEELGFDHYINYKTADIDKALVEYAPNGIDCYFDNVGGELSSKIIYKMNKFGRIAVCGAISAYTCDDDNLPKVTEVQTPIKINHLKMEGFITIRWESQIPEAIENLLQWFNDEKIKNKETIIEGFGNMPEAYIGLFEGKNYGKTIVSI